MFQLLSWSTFGEGASFSPEPPPPPPPTPPMTMLTIRKRLSFTYDSDLEVLRQQMNLLTALAENHTNSDPGLAIGTADAADILIANTVAYVRAGEVRASKASAEVAITAAATMPNDGTVRSVIVAVVIDAADNFATIAGAVARNGVTPPFPVIPVGNVLLGYVTIAAAAGTAFTPGTTLLSAVGITDTYVDAIRPTWALAQLIDVNARV